MELTREGLDEIVYEYLSSFKMSPTVSSSIRRLADPAMDLNLIGHDVSSNQAFRHFLLQFASVHRRGSRFSDAEEVDNIAETENLDQVVGLFGRQGFRNLLFALQLRRNTGPNLPTKPEHPLSLDAKKIFSFGFEMEEYCEDKRIPNPNVAFEAGVLFDWVGSIAEFRKRDKGPFQDYSGKIQKSSKQLRLKNKPQQKLLLNLNPSKIVH